MQRKTKTKMWKLDGPLMHKTLARGTMRLVQRICLVWCLPAMVSGEMRPIVDSRAAGFSYVDSRAYGFNCFNYVLWLHHYHHYTHTLGNVNDTGFSQVANLMARTPKKLWYCRTKIL